MSAFDIAMRKQRFDTGIDRCFHTLEDTFKIGIAVAAWNVYLAKT